MPEKIEELVRKAVADAQEAGDLPAFEVGDLGLERPADAGNGDWTTTLALRSARLAHMAPRAIAQAIVNHMEKDPRHLQGVEVAGPGFVNFYLSAAANNEVFRTVRASRAMTLGAPTLAPARRSRSSLSRPTPWDRSTLVTAAGPPLATRSAA